MHISLNNYVLHVNVGVRCNIFENLRIIIGEKSEYKLC